MPGNTVKNMQNELVSFLKGKLIVSCQANSSEPLYSPEAILLMAKASIEGGASALRAEGTQSIRQMKHFFGVPLIGLIKKEYPDSDVYITPTIKEVEMASIAGSDIIATDATMRKRPFNQKLEDLLDLIKNKYKLLAMADISTYDEALNAERLGFDIIGTTLSGYTPYSTQSKEPDFELLKKIVENIKVPVIMEGKLWEPEQARKAMNSGAHALVIGSAISRPQLITRRFSESINLNT